MDWALPDGTAMEGIPELLEVEPGIPIVVLSSNCHLERVVSVMRCGAYDMLEKPITEDALQMAVLRAVRAERNTTTKIHGAASDDAEMDLPDQMLFSVPLGTPLRQAEEQLIDATLKHCEGSIPACAQVLQVSASTLYRKMEARKRAK